MFPPDSTRPKESADRGVQGAEAPKSDALGKEARLEHCMILIDSFGTPLDALFS